MESGVSDGDEGVRDRRHRDQLFTTLGGRNRTRKREGRRGTRRQSRGKKSAREADKAFGSGRSRSPSIPPMLADLRIIIILIVYGLKLLGARFRGPVRLTSNRVEVRHNNGLAESSYFPSMYVFPSTNSLTQLIRHNKELIAH